MDTATETVDTGTDETEVAPVEETTEIPVTDSREEQTPVERPPQMNRQSRKAQRLNVEAAEKRAQEFAQQLETERQERQRMAAEVAEMRGRLEERQSRETRQDQQSREADLNRKVAELRKQARSHIFFASQAKTPEAAEEAWAKHDQLQDEARGLIEDARRENWWQQQRTELTQSMPNYQAQQALTGHETSFPWLLSNKEAVSMADTRLNYLVQSGQPFNRQTVVAALTWTAKAMGIGGHTPPSDAQRARYGGVPSGEGPGGGNGARTVKMGRHEEALAKAAYPHLEAKEAFRAWAKEIGSRGGGNDE